MAHSDNPYGLTPQQWRFVQEYLARLNATEAYKQAGYKAQGNAAESAASRLLRNVKIIAALQGERERLGNALEITPERVLLEYARLAFVDMRQLSAWGPEGVRLHHSEDLTEDVTRAVAEVSQETRRFGDAETVNVKLKLHDKKGALDALAKHLDLFKDGAKLGELGQGLAALLSEARKRDAQ